MDVVETVTPNEIARALGVTGLCFRSWLRDEKAAGHPLIAPHEYRTHYRFSRAEADQLASEFAEEVLGKGATRISARAPSVHKPASLRAGSRTTRATTRPTASERPRVAYPRSDDPGHRITCEWWGQEVETLADLLRSGLRAVAVGINPAPKSVAAGHYYQGNYGQTFFRRLRKAGALPDGGGFEDDCAFAAGIGFTDVVKRPTTGANGLRPGELEHGRPILEEKFIEFDVRLIIFVFKSAAETLLGRLPPGFYGVVPRRRLGTASVFVMPRPTAPITMESDAVKKLKRALRSGS